MGAAKNILKGILLSAIYVTIVLIIPLMTFSYIRSLEVSELGIDITLDDSQYNNIVFWIIAFGLLASGCAFFKYTSPKQSVRKAVLALVQQILNCLYLWSYRFSGASVITFNIADMGVLILDLSELITVYLGIYFFLIVLRVYDLIDFLVNKEKIQIERAYK